MNATTSAIALASLILASSALSAQADTFSFTNEEKAACQEDMQKYCNSAAQDGDKLLVCMKANRTYFTPKCLTVFDEGLRRRGLR